MLQSQKDCGVPFMCPMILWQQYVRFTKYSRSLLGHFVRLTKSSGNLPEQFVKFTKYSSNLLEQFVKLTNNLFIIIFKI